ncbi:MAG TPA: galactokinase [Candidatus Baltobacteraceae bacterium]|nr:galactokinase [Candidatus Baltobacteraceae bacterium]
MQTRAPGRVNLIGEHTDYNDGFVLPCAIGYDTRVLATTRPDRMVTVRSRFDEPAVFDLDRLPEQRRGAWSDYVRGVLIELHHAQVELRGADLRISATVPLGAGLSSSASFEIAVALAMLDVAGAHIPPLELAKLAQRAEVEHVGTRCGIMDQIAVLLAHEGCALFLDTRTLEYQHIPVPREVAVVICNTMVRHDLSTGAYNERRSECERSVQLLRSRYPRVRALRDVDMKQLEAARSLLPPLLFERARHVVGENARVVQTAQALRSGNLARAGELLYESHESLRTDYAVSCAELDTMVELAKEFEGTIGARMTGGGFGGCTVNLVYAERAGAFRSHIATAYPRETGIVPEMYDGTPCAGACTARD